MTRRVLVVDDDAAVRDALAQTLELADLQPTPTGSFIEAKDHILRDFDGVILSDMRMPGRDGFHLLEYTQSVDADLPVILLTGEGDIPMAVRAMGQGAFDLLEKPCAPTDLVAVVERALRTRELTLKSRALKAQVEAGDPAARLIFGISDLANDLRQRVRTVARTATEVLVSGPPGSGISKVAEVIHLCSPHAQGPFEKHPAVALDRDAMNRALEAAQGGSLYIEEISSLPVDGQFVLLSALEAAPVARVIAGTTHDLDAAVEARAFNPDLFYRLEVMPVQIPSVSERPEDIPVLFRHYVSQAAEQAGLAVPEISQEHLATLLVQDWPGNARSLMSAAMRFVLGMPEEVSEAQDLGLAEQMARVERSLLVAALGRQNGRASEAAKALKLPRKTFYDKLARYGIRPEDFRR